jgi:hypothetical protein
MKIAILETEQWERGACLRLGAGHIVTCTADPLNERTASGYVDAGGQSVLAFKAQRPNAGGVAAAEAHRHALNIDLGYCARALPSGGCLCG